MLLVTHIVSGLIGLLSGLVILILKKGDSRHKTLGKVFLYAMMLSAIVGLVLSHLRSSIFFFVIGVFTIYLVGTGSRYIYLKLKGNDTASPKLLDWLLTILMLLSGLFMVFIGIKNIIGGNNGGIILTIFGGIGLSGVWQDLRYYRGLEKSKMFWLKVHISRMVGGFIAASTAFLVNNMSYLPDVIPGTLYWLFPTIILVPFTIRWQRKWKTN